MRLKIIDQLPIKSSVWFSDRECPSFLNLLPQAIILSRTRMEATSSGSVSAVTLFPQRKNNRAAQVLVQRGLGTMGDP